MSAEILPFKKKGAITRQDFEKWAETFKPLDLGGPRDPHSYEEIEKSLGCAFDMLGLDGKNKRSE